MLKQPEARAKKNGMPYLGTSDENLSKAGEQLLVRFSSALKTAQIFEPNNLTLLQQVNLFYTPLKKILEKEKEAVFQFRKDTLFFNSARIKFDFSSFQHFKFLADEFSRRMIGVLNFGPSMEEEQLKEFIFLLAKAPLEKKNPFDDFQRRLDALEIPPITIEKIHPFEGQPGKGGGDVKSQAKKVFLKSVVHLKEVFDRESQQKRIRIKTTRRLMQSIVNIITENESFMIGLTTLKNYHDYTLNHSVNVCILSISLGRRLGLEKKELADLGIAAFFHDIGKLEIPREILDKPGKLDEEERKFIERHPYLGAERLIRLKEMSYIPIKALYVALEHHLRTDLSGYPKLWKKHSIDIFSKIVEICDFFDAVTTERPYRKQVMTGHEALQMMFKRSGEEFDPLILKVFASLVGVYPIGSLVTLDTCELGLVIESQENSEFRLRPKVKIIADRTGCMIDGPIVNLTEKNRADNSYKRNIVKSLNPQKYGIKVSDYFFATPQS